MGEIISIQTLQERKHKELVTALDRFNIVARDFANFMHADLAPEGSEERIRRFKKCEEELGTPVVGSLEDVLSTIKMR